jgi:hypothetical protein
MFANPWLLRDYALDNYSIDRLLYIMAYSIKIRSSYTVGLLAVNAKQNKLYEELHSKMVKEHDNYEEL